MGAGNATQMADHVTDGDISLYQALEWHLTANHFPPVPVAMVAVCQRIIETQGKWGYDDCISLPEDVRWRGESQAPILAIIEEFHLDPFLEQFEEEE